MGTPVPYSGRGVGIVFVVARVRGEIFPQYCLF